MNLVNTYERAVKSVPRWAATVMGAIAHHGAIDPGVAFLPKPYTPATLARKVWEMLDKSD